jgi:hypothetical protein
MLVANLVSIFVARRVGVHRIIEITTMQVTPHTLDVIVTVSLVFIVLLLAVGLVVNTLAGAAANSATATAAATTANATTGTARGAGSSLTGISVKN